MSDEQHHLCDVPECEKSAKWVSYGSWCNEHAGQERDIRTPETRDWQNRHHYVISVGDSRENHEWDAEERGLHESTLDCACKPIFQEFSAREYILVMHEFNPEAVAPMPKVGS